MLLLMKLKGPSAGKSARGCWADGWRDGRNTNQGLHKVLVVLPLSPFRPNRPKPDSHLWMGPAGASADAVGSCDGILCFYELCAIIH